MCFHKCHNTNGGRVTLKSRCANFLSIFIAGDDVCRVCKSRFYLLIYGYMTVTFCLRQPFFKLGQFSALGGSVSVS